jgi:hypothetical protein
MQIELARARFRFARGSQRSRGARRGHRKSRRLFFLFAPAGVLSPIHWHAMQKNRQSRRDSQ